MRSIISTNNLYVTKDMNKNHPIKLGFEDKDADFVLNKVLLFVAAFCSFILLTIAFGLLNSVSILGVAGLAYYFSLNKTKKAEVEDCQHNTDYCSLDDISAIERDEKLNDEDDQLTPKFDLSTEYTLFSL